MKETEILDLIHTRHRKVNISGHDVSLIGLQANSHLPILQNALVLPMGILRARWMLKSYKTFKGAFKYIFMLYICFCILLQCYTNGKIGCFFFKLWNWYFKISKWKHPWRKSPANIDSWHIYKLVLSIPLNIAKLEEKKLFPHL